MTEERPIASSREKWVAFALIATCWSAAAFLAWRKPTSAPAAVPTTAAAISPIGLTGLTPAGDTASLASDAAADASAATHQAEPMALGALSASTEEVVGDRWSFSGYLASADAVRGNSWQDWSQAPVAAGAALSAASPTVMGWRANAATAQSAMALAYASLPLGNAWQGTAHVSGLGQVLRAEPVEMTDQATPVAVAPSDQRLVRHSGGFGRVLGDGKGDAGDGWTNGLAGDIGSDPSFEAVAAVLEISDGEASPSKSIATDRGIGDLPGGLASKPIYKVVATAVSEPQTVALVMLAVMGAGLASRRPRRNIAP